MSRGKIRSLSPICLSTFSTILLRSRTTRFHKETVWTGLEGKTCPSGRGRHLPSFSASNALGLASPGHSFSRKTAPKQGAPPWLPTCSMPGFSANWRKTLRLPGLCAAQGDGLQPIAASKHASLPCWAETRIQVCMTPTKISHHSQALWPHSNITCYWRHRLGLGAFFVWLVWGLLLLLG